MDRAFHLNNISEKNVLKDMSAEISKAESIRKRPQKCLRDCAESLD